MKRVSGKLFHGERDLMIETPDGDFFLCDTHGYSAGDFVTVEYEPQDQFAHILPNVSEHILTDQEHATILAALRFYQENGQGDPANRSLDIHEIATNGDDVISLDEKGIDELCEMLNTQ
jgi:hypothetical protein